ncbi:hypothetical protein LNQ03_24005 [Klebsiella pneumoniae subsp. pneumoniae]|nr:hypothetical protein [Klebsiella pneumoniae subsp. pneumoniae]
MDYLLLCRTETKARAGGSAAARLLNVRSFLLRAQAQVQVVAETLSPALADLAARQAPQLAGDGIQRLAGG